MSQDLQKKLLHAKRLRLFLTRCWETTITEQLLLFGGVIRSAGTVKGKKSGKFATSDWMEIENNVVSR